MSNLTVGAKHLKSCLDTHKERTGEGQQSLASQLGCTQGAISQASRQTETNGYKSLGVPQTIRLLNIIGGDIYSYMPEFVAPRSATDRKSDKVAYYYLMALASPHPKPEQRVDIPDMFKGGFSQHPHDRPCQLDATHPEYRHTLVYLFQCSNLFIAKALELSVLDKFVHVRNSEYICASEADILAHIAKAMEMWSNKRIQALPLCP